MKPKQAWKPAELARRERRKADKLLRQIISFTRKHFSKTDFRTRARMVSVLRLQCELRRDLFLLVAAAPEMPEELRSRIDRRLPRLRYFSTGLGVDRTAGLAQQLYYRLALAVSRGAAERLATCTQCDAVFLRTLLRHEARGNFFCSKECRWAFHNMKKRARHADVRKPL